MSADDVLLVEFDGAVRGSYWWEKRGVVAVALDSIESFETKYDRSPSGNEVPACVLLVTKTGAQHHVYGDYEEVMRRITYACGLRPEAGADE